MKGRKPNPHRPRYAKLIAEARIKNGLTQAQLGKAAGKDEATIKKYEGGKLIPPFDSLYNICAILGIDVYDAMDLDLKHGNSTGFHEFIDKPFQEAINLVSDDIEIIPEQELGTGTDDDVIVIYKRNQTGHTTKTHFVLQVSEIKRRLKEQYYAELTKAVSTLARDIATSRKNE